MRRYIIIFFALAVSLAVVRAEVGDGIALARLTEIRVGTPSNWWLRVYTNGSATLFGEAAARGSAHCPSNTFGFSKVYDLLSKAAQTNGTAGERYSITFEPGHGRFFTSDGGAVRRLFTTAKEHCTPTDRKRFDELWSKRPPIPRD